MQAQLGSLKEGQEAQRLTFEVSLVVSLTDMHQCRSWFLHGSDPNVVDGQRHIVDGFVLP